MTVESRRMRSAFYRGGIYILSAGLFFVLFDRPLKKVMMPLFKAWFKSVNSDIVFTVMFYIFLGCSFLLVCILYWLFWSERRLKSKISRYFSKLVCPDYYAGEQHLHFESVVGDVISRQRSRELEADDDFKHDGTSEADRMTPPTGTRAYPDTVTRDGDHEIRRSFYPGGRLKVEASYRNGMLDGLFRTFYEEGTLHQEKFYVKGRLNGVYRSLDEEGGLFFEIEYRDDKQHGKDRIYFKGGGIQYEDTYVSGKRVKRKTFDRSGVLKFSQDFN